MITIRAQLEAIRPNSDRLLASDNSGRVAGVILTLRFFIIIILVVVVVIVVVGIVIVNSIIVFVLLLVFAFVLVVIRSTNYNIPITFLLILGHEQRIRKTFSPATLHLGMGYLRCKPLSNWITNIWNGIPEVQTLVK